MKLSDGRLEYERSFHDDDYGRRKERGKTSDAWSSDRGISTMHSFGFVPS